MMSWAFIPLSRKRRFRKRITDIDTKTKELQSIKQKKEAKK